MSVTKRKGWYCPREECGARILWEMEQVTAPKTEGVWSLETRCPKCKAWVKITKRGVTVLVEPPRKTIITKRRR